MSQLVPLLTLEVFGKAKVWQKVVTEEGCFLQEVQKQEIKEAETGDKIHLSGPVTCSLSLSPVFLEPIQNSLAD